MIPFALFGSLIGAIVGTRFLILTLIPVMTCAVIIGVTSSVLHNSAIGPTIIELAVLLAFIQIGYVCTAPPLRSDGPNDPQIEVTRGRQRLERWREDHQQSAQPERRGRVRLAALQSNPRARALHHLRGRGKG